MCGIVAALDPRGALVPGCLKLALESLKHRGPDGQGTYHAPDRRIALGHSRLALVDPAGGSQPFVHPQRDLVCVVNGELYDSRQLSARLEAGGARFRSRCDSEILLHAYAQLGLDAITELQGEFAFALWDGATQQLIVGRDRFGIKPVVYAWEQTRLWVASEAKALFALGVSPKWDTQSVLHALSHQYLPPHRTMFAGVRQLPPGHLLIAKIGQAPRLVRYWDIPATTEPPADLCEQILQAQTLERLRDAVVQRLRGDVPVCVHLSGGLDSTAIAALAAQNSAHRLAAFCVRFDDPAYQEDQPARQAANALEVDLHVVEVGQLALVEALPDAIFYGETFGINGQLPAKLCLSRAISAAGYKVVLSGEGADEAFFGYAHLWRDAGQQLPEVDHQRGVMLAHGESPRLNVLEAAWGSVPNFMLAKAGIGARVGPLLSHSLQHRLASWDPFAALAEDLNANFLSTWSPVPRAAYLWTKLALGGYILRALGDGMEMAASVEGRTPFLDHFLFEHAQQLGVIRRLGGKLEKQHLREALAGVVPNTIRWRPKHPFLAPPLALAPGTPGHEFVGDWLSSRSFRELPFFNVELAQNYVEQIPNMPASARVAADPVVMLMLSACLMQERFGLGFEETM